MEATLNFKLPDDEFQFRRALNGHKWSQIVYDIDETLRRELKHTEGLTKKQRACYEEVRELIREEMSEHNLYFDE